MQNSKVTHDDICAGATENGVASRPTENGVFPVTCIDRVVALSRKHTDDGIGWHKGNQYALIVTLHCRLITGNDVITIATDNRIPLNSPHNNVRPAERRQRVGISIGKLAVDCYHIRHNSRGIKDRLHMIAGNNIVANAAANPIRTGAANGQI